MNTVRLMPLPRKPKAPDATSRAAARPTDRF
jgi:hypothetical protein